MWINASFLETEEIYSNNDKESSFNSLGVEQVNNIRMDIYKFT